VAPVVAAGQRVADRQIRQHLLRAILLTPQARVAVRGDGAEGVREQDQHRHRHQMARRFEVLDPRQRDEDEAGPERDRRPCAGGSG
jgi:hypothetical protein